MDWADELAASVQGPQVVNDSKTPSGTVHVGSLRGPVILDVITRALRAQRPRDHAALRRRRPRPDGRPGAPVARRDRARDGRARSPTCPTRSATATRRTRATSPSLFIDTFDGLGIHPDRYYWMSDIYPTGQVDPFIRTALDKAAVVREIYRRVANVQHPDYWLPVSVICPNCGKVGHDDRDGLGRPDGRRRVPPGPRRLGDRLRLDRPRLAVRRQRQAALEPRVGGAVAPVRRHDRAQRQGPRDGRRVARPIGRHRARGLRVRAAAQLPVRVPQHRRQEDVDVEGTGRGRPPVHRDRAAGADALPVRPAATGERHRLRPRGHRRGPAPVRRVRPARRRHRGPRGQGRGPVGLRLDLPLLAARPGCGRGAGRGRVPPRVRAPRAPRPGARRRRRGAGRGGEGLAADRRRGGGVRGPRSPPSAAGSRRTPPSVRGSRSAGTRCRSRSTSCARSSAGSCARWPRPPTATRRRPASSGRRRSSPSRPTTRSTRRPRSTRSTSPSSDARTARGPAGSWRAWSGTS